MKHIYILLFVLLSVYSISAQQFPDRHTTSPSDGWKSCQESMNPIADLGMSHWILFDFQTIESLSTVQMWNVNDPANLEDGLIDFRVDYSLDNVNWNEYGTFQIGISDGSAFYNGEEVFDFNGTTARYVLITAVSNGGGTCYGFDEIRFYLGVTVPTELSEFTVSCNEGNKKLSWKFADVSDFGSLTVESSQDGREWNSIHNTSEKGEINNEGFYNNEFTDRTNESSKSEFYRLKIYDINGDFEYSEIIESNCILDEKNLELYPNPVQADLTIDLELQNRSEVEFTLRDILGTVIQSGKFEVLAGNNRRTIKTKDLVEGSYILRLTVGNEVLEKKFIKVNW